LTLLVEKIYAMQTRKIKGGRSMTIRLTITSQVQKIAEEQRIALPPLSDDLVLLDSGLDSLCFAILVARLEDQLGVDPFTASDDVYFPVTLGDFVKVYENAAKPLAVAS
jgi:acyl carrier protein